MKVIAYLLAAILVISVSVQAQAAVPASEAAELGGPRLTEVGAERAGNADGSIPAWQPDWKGPDMPPEGGLYPDPFADERPILSITAANAAQHEHRLTPGTLALLNRWPDYRLDVYPSHRVVDFPDWLKRASIQNATRARSVHDGEDLEGAMGGYPFPIPKTGAEVIWNHNLRYYGPPYHSRLTGYLIDPTGKRIMMYDMDNYTDSPYHDNPDEEQKFYQRRLVNYYGPPRDVGTKSLTHMTLHARQDGRSRVWQYTQGQRRVRSVPDFSYDTPMFNTGGSQFYDEIGMWEGQLDRFDFNLLGKREIYVPYNTYRYLMHTPIEEAAGSRFLNPDVLRWELHRVWVVEATLKPGVRHAQSRKVFYVDEDGWSILLYEAYDQNNALMRIIQGMTVYDWNTKSIPNTQSVLYDLIKGQYSISSTPYVGPDRAGYRAIGYVRIPRLPNNRLTPESIAGSGIR